MARKPDYYFTDDRGVTRPGYRPRNRGVIVTVGLTLALGAGTAGTAATVGVSGEASISAAKGRPSSTGRVSTRARERNPTRALRRLEQRGLRVQQRGDSFSTSCASHSYGEVEQFFRDHDCSALFRALYEVRDDRAGLVLVAVAWVDMPDEARAEDYQRLVDRFGTGNITELSKEQRRYRGVRFTGRHYASLRDGVTVVNAQAEPIGIAATAEGLANIVVHETS